MSLKLLLIDCSDTAVTGADLSGQRDCRIKLVCYVVAHNKSSFCHPVLQVIFHRRGVSLTITCEAISVTVCVCVWVAGGFRFLIILCFIHVTQTQQTRPSLPRLLLSTGESSRSLPPLSLISRPPPLSLLSVFPREVNLLSSESMNSTGLEL